MSPTGQVLWTKYMGGKNYDRAYALEVDSSGNIFIAGRAGREFPMVNALQSTFKGNSNPSNYGDNNGFVAKLNSSGEVLWSTYLGTGELVRDLALDANGDVYVPLVLNGNKSSRDFTQTGLEAFAGKITNSAPTTNTSDVGVAKIKGDGSGIEWARWIGGTGDEQTNPSIRVNAAGEAHLLFSTTSTNSSLASVGAGVQTNNGGARDSYLAKFNATGTGLVYGTYLGGTDEEAHETHSLALDASGNAVIAVHTKSTNFPITPGTADGDLGTLAMSEIAVVKFNSNGVRALSAVVGGNDGNEGPDGIYVDAQGRVYISFETSSTNFPTTPGAFQSVKAGSNDGGFIVLSADLTTIEYATLFGGTLYDNARAMYLGADGAVYLTGGTLSTNLPMLNADDASFNGGSHNFAPGSGDAWVAKFTLVPEPASLSLLLSAGLLALRRRR
jgi:hypothetical protein